MGLLSLWTILITVNKNICFGANHKIDRGKTENNIFLLLAGGRGREEGEVGRGLNTFKYVCISLLFDVLKIRNKTSSHEDFEFTRFDFTFNFLPHSDYNPCDI